MDYTVNEILKTGVSKLSLLQGIVPTIGTHIARSQPRSPTLQMDSLPDEPQGKPIHQGDEVVTKHEKRAIWETPAERNTGLWESLS